MRKRGLTNEFGYHSRSFLVKGLEEARIHKGDNREALDWVSRDERSGEKREVWKAEPVELGN